MFETISTLPLFQSLDVVGGRLILTLSNGAKLDKGAIVGPSGSAGPAGVGVTHTVVDGSGHLQVTYTDGTTVDAGQVVGAAGATGATGRGIQSTAINAGSLVVTYTDGTTATLGTVVGPTGATGAAGRGVTGTTINGSGHLILTYSDGTTADVGQVVGAAGATGSAGRGISSTAIQGGNLVLTYTDGTTSNVGNVVGPAGAAGAAGPAAWGAVAAWAANTAYTSIAPASVVTYNDGTGTRVYVAKAGIGAFTSGTTFTAANWTLIADHGATGATGAAGRGVSSLAVNSAGHLIATYTDGSTSDAGLVDPNPPVRLKMIYWERYNSSGTWNRDTFLASAVQAATQAGYVGITAANFELWFEAVGGGASGFCSGNTGPNGAGHGGGPGSVNFAKGLKQGDLAASIAYTVGAGGAVPNPSTLLTSNPGNPSTWAGLVSAAGGLGNTTGSTSTANLRIALQASQIDLGTPGAAVSDNPGPGRPGSPSNGPGGGGGGAASSYTNTVPQGGNGASSNSDNPSLTLAGGQPATAGANAIGSAQAGQNATLPFQYGSGGAGGNCPTGGSNVGGAQGGNGGYPGGGGGGAGSSTSYGHYGGGGGAGCCSVYAHLRIA